jgi:hypothetical protein
MWTFALGVLLTATHAVNCPAKYPFAYFDGKYCCFSSKEKKDTANDPACTGDDLTFGSRCCAHDHFAPCDATDATVLCTNNNLGAASRLDDGALDSSEIECGGCRGAQECRYNIESAEFECKLGLVARNALIGVFVGLFLLLILLLIIYCCCCKNKNRFEPTYLEPKAEPVPAPPVVPPQITSSSSSSHVPTPVPTPTPTPPPREPTPEPPKEPTPVPSSSSSSSSEEEPIIVQEEIQVQTVRTPTPTPPPTPTPTPPPSPPAPVLDDPLLPIPSATGGESSVTDVAVSGDETINTSAHGFGEMRPEIEAELVDLSRNNVNEYKWTDAATTDTEAATTQTVTQQAADVVYDDVGE